MFSKTRVTEPGPRTQPTPESEPPRGLDTSYDMPPAAPARARTAPSVLSSDLTVTGNIQTQGDIQVEGTVEGDIRAHQLVVGDSATIRGEIVAEEVVVNGRVIGRVRGLKVRLTATARVEGDIIHKTIAIESGAHFEGSVQRQEDPLANGVTKKLAPPAGRGSDKDGEAG
ncbi:bactofilin family protein [Paracoccus thiocyanatus]|uniref:Cell shape determination protein CcmA n=1 Tax=Paracoccus thiocyanatus TaxID=34006 RepID=A0A1N6PTW2_9RHOB|nr:polymer-forming cytoskeletal protein [Paracoccus thiocyanatus]RDW14653.1 cell shape determination protein CcmA [Paracoccus thiocyanatus]SIQ07781.1 protein CcmA, bactofilin family [Paracoccus thiocyanatus]